MPDHPTEREPLVIAAFVELADSLVDEYDPLDFLYRLLDHALPLVGASHGAVMLHYEGRLHVVAASSEETADLELFELEHDEGPGRDAFHGGEVVVVRRLDAAAERWPRFVPHATAAGQVSAISIPMRLRDHVCGALSIFWSDETSLCDQDSDLLRGFTDVATIAVLQRELSSDLERVNQQLHGALESRVHIEQAKGMIAQSAGIGVGEAFRLLRNHARSNRRMLRDVAREVTSGSVTVAQLCAPEPAQPHPAG